MTTEVAEKRVGVSIDTEQSDAAKSIAISFSAVESMGLDLSIPLRRPSKRHPSSEVDSLKAELAAWDAASDEAIEHFEEGLDAAE